MLRSYLSITLTYLDASITGSANYLSSIETEVLHIPESLRFFAPNPPDDVLRRQGIAITVLPFAMFIITLLLDFTINKCFPQFPRITLREQSRNYLTIMSVLYSGTVMIRGFTKLLSKFPNAASHGVFFYGGLLVVLGVLFILERSLYNWIRWYPSEVRAAKHDQLRRFAGHCVLWTGLCLPLVLLYACSKGLFLPL